MRNPSNPFIVSGYYGPKFFCDREEELSWLIDQHANERNSMLYSWRRMGKTALIRHFFHNLEEEKKADCIFVDLLGTSDLEEANKKIASAIVQRFGEPHKGIGPSLMKLISSIGATVGIDAMSGIPHVKFNLATSPSVPATLESIGTFLTERKKPVVICIDEFQQITNYPEDFAEATFRTWSQDFPAVRFIFSGSHRHIMSSMFSEESRPFYRSVQMKQLNPLPEGAYALFIKSFFEKSGKSIDPSHIEHIFHWTRMQTYYVQLVCNKLFGKATKVDEPLLQEVFDEIIQQEIPLFSTYQQLLTAFQWKLLIAMAKAGEVENPLSQQFIRPYNLGAASSVNTALKALVKKEFIILQDSKFMIQDTLLMRWLQQL